MLCYQGVEGTIGQVLPVPARLLQYQGPMGESSAPGAVPRSQQSASLRFTISQSVSISVALKSSWTHERSCPTKKMGCLREPIATNLLMWLTACHVSIHVWRVQYWAQDLLLPHSTRPVSLIMFPCCVEGNAFYLETWASSLTFLYSHLISHYVHKYPSCQPPRSKTTAPAVQVHCHCF